MLLITALQVNVIIDFTLAKFILFLFSHLFNNLGVRGERFKWYISFLYFLDTNWFRFRMKTYSIGSNFIWKWGCFCFSQRMKLATTGRQFVIDFSFLRVWHVSSGGTKPCSRIAWPTYAPHLFSFGGNWCECVGARAETVDRFAAAMCWNITELEDKF